MTDPLNDDPLLRPVPEVDGYKLLGPCVLYARVGAGGMGAVYRGRHLNLDLEVAVKCLKPALAEEGEDYLIRFRNEARLAATLNDPRLVRVFDVDERFGLHYLVMEYVRGETLRERVGRKGALPPGEAIRILLDAARGLAAAHRAGVIHRDIKPDNILVSAKGEVKVADLGLAKAMDSGGDLTRTRAVMGTPQYMAPEQWQDPKTIGPAADVWALGCTLWYLLAGKPPIPRGEPFEVMRRICLEPFPPLPPEVENVPDELRAIIASCTAAEPFARFPDAGALARALEALVTRAHVEATLEDDRAGLGSLRCSTISPPPAETLARLKILQKDRSNGVSEATPAIGVGGASTPEGMSAARRPRRWRLAIVLVALMGLVAGLGFWAGWFGGSESLDDRGQGPATPADPGSAEPSGNGELSEDPDVLSADEVPSRGASPAGGSERRPAPSWAEVVQWDPDPGLVTDARIRRQHIVRGLPWHVRDRRLGIELILIPPGFFPCGASPGDEDAYIDERPVHRVTLTEGFYLGRFEVTNGEYRRFRAGHDSGSYEQLSLNGDRQPAVRVSWEEAKAFCDAYGFVLPTEAQWEYACRAGTVTPYPWGDAPDAGEGFANVCDPTAKLRFRWSWNSFPWDDGFVVASDVGPFRANAFGLHDMIGNAREWCFDWYAVREYQRRVRGATNPEGPGPGEARVVRGGSWCYGPRYSRVSTRNWSDPAERSHDLGFRVARAPFP